MSDITTNAPPPTRSDESQDVEPLLLALIKARMAFGAKKYGTKLCSHNGRDAMMDALQESIDLNQYLVQLLMEQQDDR